jgi:uncharacterized repeat protein (TIGR03803 family)
MSNFSTAREAHTQENTMNKIGFGKIACIAAVFCMASAVASPAQTFTTLVSFDQTNGEFPGGLTQGTDGNLYGATTRGGANLNGTAFVMTPSGTLTPFYNFCSVKNQSLCVDGSFVNEPLIQGANGNFYTTSLFAGEYDTGSVFEVSSSGTFKLLYSFCSSGGCPNGEYPGAALTLGADGNFYGTTSGGGTHSMGGDGGTIFKITPAGDLTFLYNFCAQTSGDICLDGMSPEAALLQANDGYLYGTTDFGGANNKGTLFRITRTGTFTSLHTLAGIPNALIQGSDGSFYGTTSDGGANKDGSVFKIAPEGQISILYNFCSQTNCVDGQDPSALIQGTDGNFYGTTLVGGANSNANICGNLGCGTLFQITPSGQFTTIYNFCSQTNCVDGSRPASGLMQATNGTFYGTTAGGGTDMACGDSCGTVFSLSMGLGPFVEARNNFGKIGQIAGILGNNLTGTTNVTFNGTSASFTIVSDTYLTATVPTGATTGTIQVTTPSGTLNSNVAFQVLP